jgi:NAD(P)-dependent dehydrogenase (short-subunit alcohol dehydrogenase family)
MASTEKTAIVTGASQGIGTGLVEAFLKRGYSVVANSRHINKANPFPGAANVALVDGDIGDPRTASKIAGTAVSRFGRIDVLINNAGVFIRKPFTEYTTEDFNTLVSTTLAGFLYVSQLAVNQMVRQKSGSIINISTTLVDQPVAGVGAAVQIMLKGALNAVTRALAIEYAKEGIRVNTIAPGVINTPMHKPETHDFLKGLHPVGRLGEIKEVVDAALFLTDATFTSGEILHVDGGAHAGKW